MTYAAERKYTTEEEAKEGLDTCGYAGKWKKAKIAVDAKLSRVAGCTIQEFWDATRLHFLELGGEWLDQMGPQDPRHPEHAQYLERAAAMPKTTYVSTPTFEYREPQRSRFA